MVPLRASEASICRYRPCRTGVMLAVPPVGAPTRSMRSAEQPVLSSLRSTSIVMRLDARMPNSSSMARI